MCQYDCNAFITLSQSVFLTNSILITWNYELLMGIHRPIIPSHGMQQYLILFPTMPPGGLHTYLSFSCNMYDTKLLKEKNPLRNKKRVRKKDKQTWNTPSPLKSRLPLREKCISASSDSIWKPLSDHLTVLFPRLNAWTSRERTCHVCLL